MLALIEQALDFVVALRLGDNLPSELSSGEASWRPTIQDRQLATSRVKQHLTRCVFAQMEQPVAIIGSTIVPGWEAEPVNATLFKSVADAAVIQLDIAGTAELAARVDLMSEEMGCIETMRRSLTQGMAGMQGKLLQIPVDSVASTQRGILRQVQALARRGLKVITARIAEIDARLNDTLALLGDMTATVAWLRRLRDWLFRTYRAWEAVFTDWAGVSGRTDDRLWKAVDKSYAFLAPRFMSFQEWAVLDAKPKNQVLRAKVW